LSAAVALSACGGGPRQVNVAVRVPLGQEPSTIGSSLTLSEYTGDRKAFANAGKDSLVYDGRLWEIHDGHLLVGTLQVATVTPDISLTNGSDRSEVLNGVLDGVQPATIQVDGVGVAVSNAPQRTLYVWFGRSVFEVMQLDDARVNPEQILNQVISYQRQTGLLHPEPVPGQ
jgi:hypothetical protein